MDRLNVAVKRPVHPPIIIGSGKIDRRTSRVARREECELFI